MDVGSRGGADALQGGVGRGRKGEVFRVSVLGAGAARGETVKSLSNEWEDHPAAPPSCPIINMCLAHTEQTFTVSTVIHLFKQHLLSTCCMPDTMLGTEKNCGQNNSLYPPGADVPVGKEKIKKKKQ